MWGVKSKYLAFKEATEFVRLRKLCEQNEVLGYQARSTMYNPLRILLDGVIAEPNQDLERFLFTMLMVKPVQHSYSVIYKQIENAENWVAKTDDEFQGVLLGHMLLLSYLKGCSFVSAMKLKSEDELWSSALDKRVSSLSIIAADLTKLIGEQAKLIVNADYTPSGSLLSHSKERFNHAY